MGLLDSFSARGKATSLYKRGMKRAHEGNFDGAVADYDAILEMPKAPSELKAMALFNRALTYSSKRDYERAHEDLNAVLDMPQLPPDIREAARKKLERMKKRLDSPGNPR